MGKIFLTSDTHFNHNKDFVYAARGFKTIEEMNKAIIENWNAVVTDEDTVYLLGDVIMGEDLQAGLRLISKLKGKKYLAYGNHDTDARLKAFKTNRFFEDIQMGYRLKYGKKNFILTHYPTVTANGEDTRTINLYGHTHQTVTWYDEGLYVLNPGSIRSGEYGMIDITPSGIMVLQADV